MKSTNYELLNTNIIFQPTLYYELYYAAMFEHASSLGHLLWFLNVPLFCS